MLRRSTAVMPVCHVSHPPRHQSFSCQSTPCHPSGKISLLVSKSGLGVVDAFSHRPLWPLSTADVAANDTRLAAESLTALAVGGWLVFDLGFFRMLWCNACMGAQRFLVTWMRERTVYRPVQVRRVAQPTGTNACTWASRARIPARITGGWCRCCGRAPGRVLGRARDHRLSALAPASGAGDSCQPPVARVSRTTRLCPGK
jgi:hypothetical protein